MKHICRCCGDEYPEGRWKLGYKFCLECGIDVAQAISEGFTVAIDPKQLTQRGQHDRV